MRSSDPIDRVEWARDQRAMQSTCLWRPYTQMKTAAPPLEAVATEGVRIRLADGRTLIDGVASWWTACHGYNHPHIQEAVRRQLADMPHVMFGGFTHGPAERLASRLSELLPAGLDHVFFADSGSVAVEVAMKMAVQAWINRGQRGRTRFLAFREGYHGDTLGAMSVCDPDEGMHAHFDGWLPRQIFADLPRDAASEAALDALLAERKTELAAVIIEPLIQGAGGMRLHGPEVLATVARLARRHGLLLIADEIFTGFGRTGSMFACEQAPVVPDILCLSKALTGGVMGLAATIASHAVFETFWSDDPAKALMHGPTFMANALACAAANASLDLFEAEPRVAQAAALEVALLEGLAPCRAMPGVVEVRAKGAVGVVQLAAPPDREALKRAFVERGVWIRPFGDIVYLAPALNIGRDDLATLAAAVCSVLAERPTL
jgi:adenosylmethionine-8-amino-7-oxononanoate aminotransferase